MENIFLDASNSAVGRVASKAAKESLEGKNVFVFNCEKSIISGNKAMIIDKYKARRARGGTALKGPFYSKDTEKIMKRAIRGMLPNYRNGRGKEAWRRVKCWNGVPEEYKKEKLTSIKTNDMSKRISLEELKRKL